MLMIESGPGILFLLRKVVAISSFQIHLGSRRSSHL